MIGCGNCRFWKLDQFTRQDGPGADGYWRGDHGFLHDGTVSFCRRRSPVAQNQANSLHGGAIWPTTQNNDWCGDYELRQPPAIDPES